MEKDYLGISSTVLVSLLFGLALVLVNSWFNQPTVEEVVPRSTYLMVMIALFFIDTVAFIFMQLYFIYDRRQFSNFLSQCRVLINLLPNTPETVGIINQQLLEKLPDGAYLLNLARGVHVVEDDLLAALDSGKVKGAMLDVFNREPLPPESPLWQHPRVTITPHVAAITRPAEAVDYISRTIAQLEKGERVCGQVDRARGY